LIHPTTEQLASYSLGKLSEDQGATVAAHLEECAACQEAVLAVPDDSLVGMLRPLFAPGHDAAAALPTDSWVPTELLDHPRYRLLEWLGAGGMGVVYKAVHRLMDRPVAIKVLSKKLTNHAAVVERFRREVKAVAKLDHPHVCRAYDAEQTGDLCFLVMEYIEGVTLARLVEDHGPRPVSLACEYARQTALGLQHAFECGIRHRDLKPTNVMITPKNQVKVLDFGLASWFSEDDALAEFRAILGTPSYMAPEQGRDASSADIRADIYALGCTLYFLLVGRPPFVGATVQEKLAAHREQKPRPLSEFRQDVPDDLVRVLERMVAKEPAGRYQTPAEVAAHLASFAGTASQKRRWLGWLLGGATAGIVAVAVYIGAWESLPAVDGPLAVVARLA
jgi:eukaryotic-like serine/threonine-protein kinase